MDFFGSGDFTDFEKETADEVFEVAVDKIHQVALRAVSNSFRRVQHDQKS